VAAEPLTAAEAAAALIDARRAGRDVAAVVALSGPVCGQRILVYRDGTIRGGFGDPAVDGAARQLGCSALQDGEPRLQDSPHLFAEAQLAQPRLIIVGAGHIAVPLAHMAHLIGFEVTVLDDREEFATESRFDSNVAVRQLDVSRPFDMLELGPRCFVVLVTRAHRLDYDLLRVLLSEADQPAYIGMIGSRRRVRAAFHALIDAGVARTQLESIHAPVGLDIGAETPAEIAVSIVAELIHFRAHAGGGQPLGAHERVLDRFFSNAATDA
jgi:xanthine dehydrogenase accessory factor